ncbi:hypothetical protein [Halorubrum sp. CBA1125]|nr:hypothetical protein [Halorubrum sp. CBA1125]
MPNVSTYRLSTTATRGVFGFGVVAAELKVPATDRIAWTTGFR